MKFPPASRKASYTFLASSLAEPQPHSSPKVMVPSATSETRSPELPKSRYRIGISFFRREASFFGSGARSPARFTNDKAQASLRAYFNASWSNSREEFSAGDGRRHWRNAPMYLQNAPRVARR